MELSQEVTVISNDIEEATPEAEQVKEVEQLTATGQAEDAGKPSEEAKAERTFTQAELDEAIQKRISKFERKAERTRIEAETRQQILAEQKSVAPKALNVDDFSTWEEYNDALLDQRVENRLNKREQDVVKQQQASAAQNESERVQNLEHTLYEVGNKKFGDFDDVVESVKDNLIKAGVGFSTAGVASILDSDKSADIIHYLSKNPVEAVRIASLSEYTQAKEIGKLEDKLSATAKVKASNAPEPRTGISGGQSLEKTTDQMSVDEYKAFRLTQKPRWAR